MDLSDGVFHARLLQVKGNLIISAACAVRRSPSHLPSRVNLLDGPGPDKAVKTFLLLKISAGRKSCGDYSSACHPASQPRNVSLCLSFHVKTLQVYSAFLLLLGVFFPPFFRAYHQVSAALCTLEHRGPIRLLIRLDLREERSRCASSSMTERR